MLKQNTAASKTSIPISQPDTLYKVQAYLRVLYELYILFIDIFLNRQTHLLSPFTPLIHTVNLSRILKTPPTTTTPTMTLLPPPKR